LPTPLITLTCPNCGGNLESAGQDTFVCPYCGAVHRLRDHPDWMKELQKNFDQMKSELSDLQLNSRNVASAQALPGLLIQQGQLASGLQSRTRAIFISLVVFGLGYFFKRWLIFTADSVWILRNLPAGMMVLGGLALIYILVRTILLLRQRAKLNQQIERCREAIRNLGA